MLRRCRRARQMAACSRARRGRARARCALLSSRPTLSHRPPQRRPPPARAHACHRSAAQTLSSASRQWRRSGSPRSRGPAIRLRIRASCIDARPPSPRCSCTYRPRRQFTRSSRPSGFTRASEERPEELVDVASVRCIHTRRLPSAQSMRQAPLGAAPALTRPHGASVSLPYTPPPLLLFNRTAELTARFRPGDLSSEKISGSQIIRLRVPSPTGILSRASILVR